MKSITDWTTDVHATAKAHGWWDSTPTHEQRLATLPEKIALIHSEASEALECYRDGDIAPRRTESGKPEGLPSELADVVIRVMDLCGALGIDLEAAMRDKADYNESRPHRHGGKRC